MNDWKPISGTRDSLHLPNADLEAWKKKHPRMSKWHPNWFVDFDIKGLAKNEKLHTYSWTATKFLIQQRDKHRCRRCGTDGKDQRNTDYTGYTCHYGLEVQHIIPRKDNGADHPQNLITLCRKCHKITFGHGYGGIPGVHDTQTTLFAEGG